MYVYSCTCYISSFFQGPDISWRQLMCKLLGHSSDSIFYDNLLEMISERVGSTSRTNALVQLGLLSEEKVEKLGSPLDTISFHLANVLAYEKEERDMILMRHDVSRWRCTMLQKLSKCEVKLHNSRIYLPLNFA